MLLTPDAIFYRNQVRIQDYNLIRHNPNGIVMPTASMKDAILGVTIHNTSRKNVPIEITPAEYNTWRTLQNALRDVRVHFYVDAYGAWQLLPLDRAGWHAADGSGDGNRHTIAIECIMSPAYTLEDQLAEKHCALLAADLLLQFHLPPDALFTHTYWLHKRDGTRGNRKELNTKYHPYKNCPAYILPHWERFEAQVFAQYTRLCRTMVA